MNQDDRLGPYRLLRRLGEGGMGVVHLALDPQGRQVAVKVLRSEVAGDDVARRRLSREVETMRRVRGPNIAEVVDADVTGRRPYIVTRYVPGRPLDEIVKNDGPLSLDAVLKVAVGVAEALAVVHAAGVIHRDLKPGNVLMLDGQPVLIDFGIAQAVDATRLTQTGMFIGTPGYLAPEIIEGHEAGPQVDVHAWAGTVLFAATGQPPFGKGTLEMVFFNITSGRANVEAAPAPIQPMLRAAFNRDPARRPTAAELVRQLAWLMPQSPGGRPRVPDEITTVPNVDDTGGQQAPGAGRPGGPVAGGPPTGSPMPPITPPVAPVATPPVTPSQPGGRAEEFVSLLRETPAAGQGGDPFPTVRVTGEDLRRAGLGPAAPPNGPGNSQVESPAEGDIPTRMAPPRTPPTGPSGPSAFPGSPVSGPAPTTGGPSAPPYGRPDEWPTPMLRPEGDIPTRRVTSEEVRQAVSGDPTGPRAASPGFTQPGSPQPGSPQHGSAQHGSYDQGDVAARDHALFGHAPEIYERTPHIHQPNPAPFMPTVRVPPPTVPPMPFTPGGLFQRSKTYGVASALLLVVMTSLAVMAPLLVCLVAVPAVVLLRAADLAQPHLNSRRPAGAAAADVLRVLSRPAELVKSIGVTIALVPYALILGLPVTLLLTVLLGATPALRLAALSWGIATALWTICAGPGVVGPGRQMRRTLASLVPGEGAAKGLAWGIGALAVLTAALALSSLLGKQTAGHFWGPIDVVSVLERLRDLRNQAGNG
ncbi:protein kinase [Microbispora sp. NEAU-D428]|uniref:serine/threonine-protein kinase n=1 Tax=Microbispora sitophila TaxID=2771537 RepID=UPI001865ACEF|nr:serine/threonine-protein kinase [Microbispora sitophila]MBE3007669.1 protein kinase [Microbispora sitophila]